VIVRLETLPGFQPSFIGLQTNLVFLSNREYRGRDYKPIYCLKPRYYRYVPLRGTYQIPSDRREYSIARGGSSIS
jgi:hypothetical protein